jgi:hypothetical protein
MAKTKLHWESVDRIAKAEFSIEHVGSLRFEIDSKPPDDGARQSAEERKALALRHAKLLVRNLASELERQ